MFLSPIKMASHISTASWPHAQTPLKVWKTTQFLCGPPQKKSQWVQNLCTWLSALLKDLGKLWYSNICDLEPICPNHFWSNTSYHEHVFKEVSKYIWLQNAISIWHGCQKASDSGGWWASMNHAELMKQQQLSVLSPAIFGGMLSLFKLSTSYRNNNINIALLSSSLTPVITKVFHESFFDTTTGYKVNSSDTAKSSPATDCKTWCSTSINLPTIQVTFANISLQVCQTFKKRANLMVRHETIRHKYHVWTYIYINKYIHLKTSMSVQSAHRISIHVEFSNL